MRPQPVNTHLTLKLGYRIGRPLNCWLRHLEDVFVRLLITWVPSPAFPFVTCFGAELGYGQVIFRPEAPLETEGSQSVNNQRSDDDKYDQ